MNKLILLIFVLAICSCGQEPAKVETKVEETPKETKISAADLEKKGFKVYQQNPQQALPIFKELIGMYQEENNITKASFSSLSVASIYDENMNKPDSALIYANQSMEMWRKEGDSLQVANLLKYVGLLEGKMGDYDAATGHIADAITRYKNLDFMEGVAVANFNLAQVYTEQEDYNNAKKMLKEANDFWRKAANKDRVFTNNLFGVELYAKAGDKRTVKKLIAENKKISTEVELNGFLKGKFEELLKKHEK